jgi:cytochrome P450
MLMSDRINLFLPEVRRDPYPTYQALRAAPPQQVEPGGLWAISRYEDALFALKHPEIFSSAGFEALYKPAWLPHNPLADSLFTMDGPAHTKLRALVARAFAPKSMARLEPRVRTIAAECAEALLGCEECDFVERFSVAFPARVIAEILGLDPALHARFREWTDHIASISPVPPPEEIADAIRGTVTTMERYLREVVAARRAAPADDIVSDLITAEVDGATLTDEEIVAFLFLLLPAGFETTRHTLANIMLAFLDRPADFEALRADRSRIAGFVEESLRHDPPVHAVVRLITQDVELSGAKLPAGGMAMILIGATGRDGAQHADPERFDMTRESTNLLSFGHGAHYCLGAALARLEARIGIEELAARFRGFERAPGEVTWNMVPTVRGPNNLPIRPLAA